MSIWCSIEGTYALHYENSATDPRTAKRLLGLFPGEFGDEIDLAVVPDYVFDDTKVGDSYLPYLRVGIIANNTAEGDVILNRNQVKKLRNELNKFLSDTRKKKKKIAPIEEVFSICDFMWHSTQNHVKGDNHSCTLKANHDGNHICCCNYEHLVVGDIKTCDCGGDYHELDCKQH